MTELTRRRSKDRLVESWHIYYGDVQVGSIGMRSGVPNDVDQWGWTCGFISQRLRIAEGTAPTFALARAKFEEAWHAYLPGCIDAHFAELASTAPGPHGNTQCMMPVCGCRPR
jgi:hypothetical protein